MNLDLKEDFEIIEEGTKYRLPEYEVLDGQGIKKTEGKRAGNGEFYKVPHPIEIRFVRGSKLGDEDVEKRNGTLHEHLLAMMIHDLKFKSKLVPSRETSLAITKLEEGLMWLRQRQIDRLKREVEGTYKK
jgi:hypothetical protein